MTEEQKKAIDACKDQAAKETGYYADWVHVMIRKDDMDLEQVTDRAMQLYGEQCRPKWIPVTERVPDSNRPVELFCERNGKMYQAIGFYTKSKETEVGRDNDRDQDYDEEIGEYYLKPGFYEEEEVSSHEYDFLYVPRKATHWKELTAQA